MKGDFKLITFISIIIGLITGLFFGRTILDILTFDIPMIIKGYPSCFERNPTISVIFSLLMHSIISSIVGLLCFYFLELTPFLIAFILITIVPIPAKLTKEQKFYAFIMKHHLSLSSALQIAIRLNTDPSDISEIYDLYINLSNFN